MSLTESPPTPEYIFRGHTDQINTLEFYHNNSRLLSGDEGGNFIIWDMKTRRSLAIFKAHSEGILKVTGWMDKLISHGRDNLILMWKDVSNLLNDSTTESIKPILRISVNSLNFCQFSMCPKGSEEIYIAVPNLTDSSGIDIWELTSQRRLVDGIGLDKIYSQKGYCMALKLFDKSSKGLASNQAYYILAAYENGGVYLWEVDCSTGLKKACWNQTEHSESALSVDISQNWAFAISVAGDNKIVKYKFAESIDQPPKISQVTIKTPGISYVCIRSDAKIFATAGWDSKVRVFSAKTLKPLAILSYHTQSIQTLAFSHVKSDVEKEPENSENSSNETEEPKNYLVVGGKDARISLWEIY
ncbi:hypothetical protein G9A89_020015 [Geosiphon pyriformis]|nr:hypothetical protein G9A89_020015 [Geosiphon pyriformis]